MNTRKHAHNAGFTLVEILIVVVILGILSAIVIPQFTSASDTAKANALTTQLQTIRSQLELYRVQHNDTYPDLAGDDGWELLTKKTDASGTVDADGAFGPYLQKAPANSFGGASTISALTVGDDPSTTGTAGWAYDRTTGEIRGILSSDNADKVGMTEADGDIVLVTEQQGS